VEAWGGREKNIYSFMVGRPEGKRLLGRPGPRLQDNIKIDVK
jgi:hypothetical protein